MALRAAATLAAAYAARYASTSPNEPVGAIVDLAAAAETLDTVQAASVRSFSQPTDKLVFVRAKEGFLEAGEHIFVGDYVEVKESVAKMLVARGAADFASEAEVAEASKPQKGSK
jgi:hypothetical protein